MAQPQPLELPNQLPRPKTMDPEERLFRHEKMPDWGVGLWVREEKNRRRLRFEDGEMRAFRKGHYHLLVPVDGTRIDVDDIYQRIASEHEILVAEASDAAPAKPPVMSFEEQLMVFRRLYPEGFGDPEYIDAYRAPVPGGHARKSHVDLALQRAATDLSADVLRTALDEGRATDIHTAVVALLHGSPVVTPTRLRAISNLPPSDHFAFADVMFQLLHGEGRYRERFENWLRTLRQLSGSDIGWPLATALSALVHPSRHVVLKTRVFQLQARSLAPAEPVKKVPTRRGYRKGRRVALATEKALKEAGLAPRDLFDVSYFIWETLRPKGRTMLESMKEGA